MPGHHVAHQSLIAGNILPNDGDSLFDSGMLINNCFHLTQLDPETPNLDLQIDTAQVFHLAVCPVPNPVTGFVQSAARRIEGIREEPIAFQPGPVRVSGCEALATDIEFTGNPDGYPPHPRIQHVELCILDRTADGNRAMFFHAAETRPDGGFGRPVQVPDGFAPFQQLIRQVFGKRFTAT